MKILITTEWYAPVINGVVTSVINLQKELEKSGHEVKILTLSRDRKSFILDGVTYISSFGAEKIYPNARFTIHIEGKYIEDIIDWHPDIIHSQCEFSTFIMARNIAKKANIPIVHTYHTVYEDYTHYFSLSKRWGKRMVAILTKKILSQTQGVIVPTDKVRSLLLKYGVNEKIYVIPTGIDLDRLVQVIDEKQKQELRLKIGIPTENKVMVYVGRLAKEKNLEEILLYYSHLNNENTTLLVVGDGPHRENLELYADKLNIKGKIIFTGMVSPKEVSYYYQLGDLFVSASQSETQGLTYVESLANGTPPLCRRDQVIENVIIDGVNGYQYDNFDDFKHKVSLILEDEDHRNSLSHNAKTYAFRDYSSYSFAKKIEKVYQDTIDDYKKNPVHKNIFTLLK